jgi:WS/DGAT/MGAT family acyltransferase
MAPDGIGRHGPDTSLEVAPGPRTGNPRGAMSSSADRLSPLDLSLLETEDHGAHMHVASVMIFGGEPPEWDELREAIEGRLHLVPRYRQRLANVPYRQGRPVWVDDTRFTISYHLRHEGLPAPGADVQLKELAGRLVSQRLDRTKPLWELYLVDGLIDGGFALIAKTHHALVDGVSGIDLATALLDTAPVPPPAHAWHPRPAPGRAQLVADAIAERAPSPARVARRAAARLTGAPHALAGAIRTAPATPLNVKTGPHRRHDWFSVDLATLKAIKDELGGTVNDVVLAAVSLAVGRWLRRHGGMREALELRALVPVSVRANAGGGALGNAVAPVFAPLPVTIEDPEEVHRRVHEAMSGLKEAGQAVAADVLTQLGDFAPPTILHQAARLNARSRWFNLVVTNVPGPQTPLHLRGRRLERLYPVVPLAPQHALGISAMSYDGQVGFGLLGDRDVLADLDELTADLHGAIGELARVAGVRLPSAPTARA